MNLDEAYVILGISSTATLDEILLAYKGKAKKYHPDLNHSPDATRKMQMVNEAFELIRAKQKSQETIRTSRNENESNDNSTRQEYNKEKRAKNFEASIQDNIFYKVVLFADGSLFIPKFCPVCLKNTTNRISRPFSFTETIFISNRRYRVREHSSTIPFYCCCEDKFNEYVKIFRNSNYIYFYFKNREYAEFFAEINNANCSQITRIRQIADKTAHVANIAFQIPEIKQLFSIGISIGVILLLAVTCDALG